MKEYISHTKRTTQFITFGFTSTLLFRLYQLKRWVIIKHKLLYVTICKRNVALCFFTIFSHVCLNLFCSLLDGIIHLRN